jgi:protein-disulfide isomerase
LIPLGEEDLNHLLDFLDADNSRKRCLSWPRTPCTILALVVLGFGGASGAVSQTTQSPPEAAKPVTAAAKNATTAKPSQTVTPPVKAYGSKDAPITMEVFSDYQCPSCRSLFETTLRPMIDDYVAKGKVYLVHRDFPLQNHMYSGLAARWANAAARIGEFQTVEAALYDNQNSWEANGDIQKYIFTAMPEADFKRIEALTKGCELPAPTSKWDGSNPLAQVAHPCPLDYFIASDIQLGYKVPVQATPTYVITYKGQHLPPASGAVSWPILKQFFDSLLAQ